jgi:hypothetical protein
LSAGHLIQEFRIDGVIGEGGFSIVYDAYDLSLGRSVALKEYLPHSLAARGPGDAVVVRSERQRETFRLGLRSFVNEARLLASFDHPALVKVYRFWEQNDTAYMVMPYYQGPTLRTHLRELRGRPDEAWLRTLLDPLLQALATIHEARVFHRDVAPDNILLLGGDPRRPAPLLLDFGAARRVIGDATQALTVILKPGFAPVEQYAESASMKQGPWTDIYALCAVLYTAVVGRVPVPSVSRIMTDELLPAASLAHSRYSHDFLAAIDKGLAVRPEHRPQSVGELRALFDGGETIPPSRVPVQGSAPAGPAIGRGGDELPTVMPPRPPAGAAVDGLPTLIAAAGPGAAPPDAGRGAPTPFDDLLGGLTPTDTDATVLPPPRPPARGAAGGPAVRTPSPEPAPTHAPRSSGRLVLGGVGIAALALIVGTVWLITRPEPRDGAAAPTTPVATAAPAAAGALPQPAPNPPAAQPPEPVPTVAPTPTPVVPFSVLAALDDVVRHADRSIAVMAQADPAVLVIGRDRLRFRIRASEPGYVYVFTGGTDKSHFYLLFPNQLDRNHRLEADRELVLPRAGWSITASGPPGTNQLAVVVSRNPRDFDGTGLRKASAREPIPEIDLAMAAQRWAARTPGTSPFLGVPLCPAGVPCDARYGATMLEITETAAR